MDIHATYKGIVLASSAVGDYDKRLIILTKEKGKITAFARGARRPKSQFLASSRPMAYGEFSLYEGKSAYNLTNVSITEYFDEVASDLDAVYYATYFLELADYYSVENLESGEMLNLLYYSIKALSNKLIPNNLVRRIYELKIMGINGEAPQVFSCNKCKGKDNLEFYIYNAHTLVCNNCIDEYRKERNISALNDVRLNKTTVYTMQYILSYPIDKLFTFYLKDEIYKEFERVVKKHIGLYIQKHFKSLEMLKIIEKM